jgi:hypothetical protein
MAEEVGKVMGRRKILLGKMPARVKVEFLSSL